VTSRSYALVCALLVLAIALPFRGAAEQPPSPGKPAASYDVGSLHIDEYGSGDETPLIFIPALFCGPWEWYGEIARFAPDHKVYAIDAATGRIDWTYRAGNGTLYAPTAAGGTVYVGSTDSHLYAISTGS